MDFKLASLINEIDLEIKYTLQIYDKDKVDTASLKADDFSKLQKSKNLYDMAKLLENYLVINNIFDFDMEIIDLMKNKTYDYNSLKTIQDCFNKYTKVYAFEFNKLQNQVGGIIDKKKENDKYLGTYPVYIKVEENRCVIERMVITINSRAILYKTQTKLMFKVTTMEYVIPLKNYLFNNEDLRNLSKDEIFNLLDKHTKINMKNANYYDSFPVILDYENDQIILPSTMLVLKALEEKTGSFRGMNYIIKDGLKRTGITIIILIVLTILLIIFEVLG